MAGETSYGSAEISRNETVSVGVTTSVVVQKAPRKLLYIRNSSAGGQVVTLSFGELAVANNGIVLAPGDYYLESDDSNFQVWESAISAISDLAGATLSIVER